MGTGIMALGHEVREPFAQAVLDRLDTPFVARYVRLNMEAFAGA